MRDTGVHVGAARAPALCARHGQRNPRETRSVSGSMRHLSLTTCRASHVPAGPWLDCVLCAGRRSAPEILPARRPAALATAATVRGAGVPRAGPVLMPECRQAASGRPGLRAGRAHDHTDNLAHRIHRYHVTLGARHTAVSLHNRLSALLSLKLGLATGTAAAQRAVRHWLQARLDDNGDLFRSTGCLHFAGTETATEWRSFMEGALQSADRTAEAIVQASR